MCNIIFLILYFTNEDSIFPSNFDIIHPVVLGI
jgi:hypothetical protein